MRHRTCTYAWDYSRYAAPIFQGRCLCFRSTTILLVESFYVFTSVLYYSTTRTILYCINSVFCGIHTLPPLTVLPDRLTRQFHRCFLLFAVDVSQPWWEVYISHLAKWDRILYMYYASSQCHHTKGCLNRIFLLYLRHIVVSIASIWPHKQYTDFHHVASPCG